MGLQESWPAIRNRFEAFWSQEIYDRCMMAVTAPLATKRWPEVPLETRWFDPEWILAQKRGDFATTYFCGDAFPQIWVNLGASGHAAFFDGATFLLDQETVWFPPSIDEETDNVPVFDPSAPMLQMTLDHAEYYRKQNLRDYFVSMPDTAGNLDALAHLRGTENLLIDMHARPEWVRRALQPIQTAWEMVTDQSFEIIEEVNDGGSTIGWLNTWAPGKHAQLQCDLSVMISPADFGEFVVPELAAQASLLDYPLYHLDGADQLRHLDHILSVPGIAAVQWTCVEGQLSPVHYLPSLKRIQDAGRSLVVPLYAGHTEEEIVILLSELSSRGLLIVASASSRQEADWLLQLAERHTHD